MGRTIMHVDAEKKKKGKRGSDKQKETSIHMDRYIWMGENGKEKQSFYIHGSW